MDLASPAACRRVLRSFYFDIICICQVQAPYSQPGGAFFFTVTLTAGDMLVQIFMSPPGLIFTPQLNDLKTFETF
jgi:hypothetical protein